MAGCKGNMALVAELKKSDSGKYQVLGIDQSSDDVWVQAEYDTASQALIQANSLTKQALKHASDPCEASVYCAYNPNGEYLGPSLETILGSLL